MNELAILQPEQKKFFELNGFLVVEDALAPSMIDRLLEPVDGLEARLRNEPGKSAHSKADKRNLVLEDLDAFLPMLDWPRTAPLAWQILGWNVHLITSHVIFLPPAAAGTDPHSLSNGFHRDGGTSPTDLSEPHPRMFIKIAYFLTDVAAPDSGALQVVPGSHRLFGPPPALNGGPIPHGAIELRVKAGTAVLFENRTYHGVGQNLSPITRKSVYFGYGYRWVRPMDYAQMPQEVLARCNPVQRQLLSDSSYDLGHYIPKDADVPIRNILQQLQSPKA